MDKIGERLASFDKDAIGNLQRVSFTLTASQKRHEQLHAILLAEPAIHTLRNFHDPEED
jgi:hypothetical protein